MSFSEQLGGAIAAVRTFAQIETLNRDIAAAWGAHVIDDAAAQAAIEALDARKRALKQSQPALPLGLPSAAARPPKRQWPPKRRPRSPNRARSIGRRRAEAASGMLPPDLARHFTQGEQAALSIIAREAAAHGQCALCVDAIAARAGVCPRVVQTAQRQAQDCGLLTIQERPQPGRKNLSNVVRIVSREWLAWLRGLSGDRVQKSATHGSQLKNINPRGRVETAPAPRRPALTQIFGLAMGGTAQRLE